MTRSLVDVAQDVIIREHDCNTTKDLLNMTAITEGEKLLFLLNDRLLGRTIAEDIVDAEGNVIIKANTTFNKEDIKKITEFKLKKVKIRSALTCECEYGICQKCYGWALTNKKPVDIGEAIGIIAAQSIGEPGTQLTMRTFHTGGVFRGASSYEKIKSEVDGKVVSRVNTRDLRTRHGDEVEVSIKDGKLKSKIQKAKNHSFNIPYGATVFYNTGDKVKKGDIIGDLNLAQSEVTEAV